MIFLNNRYTVFMFYSFFTAVGFGIDNIVFAVEDTHHHHQKDEYSLTARQKRVYTFLLLEVVLCAIFP